MLWVGCGGRDGEGFMCGVFVLVFVWRRFVVERITLLVERNLNDIDRFYKILLQN